MSIPLNTWFRGPGNYSNIQIQGFVVGKMAPEQKSKSNLYGLWHLNIVSQGNQK